MDVAAIQPFGVLGLVCFVGLMIWAGIGDARTFLIPNELNLLIAISFVVLCLPMGMAVTEVRSHVLVGLGVSLVAMILFLIGVYGGGDFKMTGAIALWLGPAPLLPFLFYTALAGGVLSLTLIVARRLARHYGLPLSPRWLRRLLRRSAGAPYGIALGIGAVLATPSAVWFPSFIPV